MTAKLCFLIFLTIIFQEVVKANLKSNAKISATGHLSLRSRGKRFSVYKQKLTWPQALLFCRRRNKQLASVQDEDQHQAVRDEVNRLSKTYQGVKNGKFWIGGGVDGSDWVWSTTGKQLDYVVWAKGQPKQKQLCLQLNGKEDFKFSSGKCEEINMFVCQD